MIRLLIADDHAIVREGLKQIIADTPDMKVCGEAGSGDEAFDKAMRENYDVIVMDITMPGSNILDLLKKFKDHVPDTPVLILSMHPEEQYAVRVLKAGAFGYLTKESAPQELFHAIRRVAAKRRYVSSSFAEKLVADIGTDHEKSPHERLSDREYQVMVLLASGRTGREIAAQLYLSEKTVSTYRARILQKMKLHSNAELIRYVLEHLPEA
jgi:two-component system, NarL family, invasion response regulator UvrY